jgi:hypothetical protein
VHANVGRWVLLLWYYVPWYVILITVWPLLWLPWPLLIDDDIVC